MSDESKNGHSGREGRSPAKPNAPTRDVGNVLKSVWQKTVSEQVPDDLMDLLRKLD